jgi:hypothetical protein
MSQNTNLVPVDLSQLPSIQLGTDADFAEIAKSSDFLGRLQLYTKGKAVNKGLVRPGHYGIPEGDDAVEDLGNEINILALARRPKALDMTDTDAVIAVYDVKNPEFIRIQEEAAKKESHCMYGPSFLIYEVKTKRFLEYFCGTKSSRSEAKKLFPFLPLTQVIIDAMAARGEDVSNLTPHGPLPLTLKSKLVEKGTYSWHVPVVVPCAVPATTLPKQEVFVKEITCFLTISGDAGTETVKDDGGKKRAR